MNRRCLSLFLTVAMMLSLLTLPAEASNTAVTTGLDFTNAAACAAYATETNGIRWNADLNSLTLNNAVINAADGPALILPSYTDIQLIGDNTITVGGGETSIGIYVPDEMIDEECCRGVLYIQNSGSLTITTGEAVQSSIGIMAGDLYLEDCTVTAKAGNITNAEQTDSEMSCGVYTSGGSELENARLTVSAKGTQACAIYCAEDLSLDSNSTLTASHDTAGAANPAVKAEAIYAADAIVNAKDKDGASYRSKITSTLVMPDAGTSVTVTFPDICSVNGANYKNLKTAVDAAAGSYSVILSADVTLDKSLHLDEEVAAVLDLNGHLLRLAGGADDDAVIENYGTLTIADGNTSATHKWVPDSNGIWALDDNASGISDKDYFITHGGCISGGRGAVGIINSGALTLASGNIVGCCGVKPQEEDFPDYDGGGIYMSPYFSGSTSGFLMTGGRICGNGAQYGGGIYVSDGMVTLSGGSIDHNTAFEENLGFGLTRGGDGGGVMLMSGTLNVSGGGVDHNRAYSYGGGVYINGGAALTMTSGHIDTNSAGYGGGAYVVTSYVWDSELQESVEAPGIVKLSGGSITDNAVSENGGGIYLNGELTVGGTVNISNNLDEKGNSNVCLGNQSVITVGNGMGEGKNGVAAPTGMAVIGISANTAPYAVTAEGSGDSSAWFKADSFGFDVKYEESTDNVLLTGPDYSLYLKAGKVYKNNADGEEMTAGFAVNGLSYDGGIWKMDDFRFSTTAETAVIFADDSAALTIEDLNYVAGGFSDAASLSAGNLTVTASEENSRLYATGITADSITVTGKAVLTIYGNVISQSRPEAYAGPITGDNKLGWDDINKTYTGVEYGLYLSKLIPFNGCFGNEDCTFDSYTYGEMRRFDETDYTFLGWYPDGDFTAERLRQASDADHFDSFVARWAETKRVSALTVENGLAEVDASTAVIAILPSGVSNMTSLQVELENGTVSFDSAALGVIKTNATSGSVALMLEKPTAAEDMSAYRKAVSAGSAPVLLSVSLTKDSVVGDEVFNSGNAAGQAQLTVPYSSRGSVAAYCLNGGSITAVPCRYDRASQTATLMLSHFSEYVLVTKYREVYHSVTVSDNTVPNRFVDVSAGDYYYDAVLWAAENGITDGADAAHFAPKATTTRAQMVTFLWRAAGSPEPATTVCAFTDVVKGSYYEKAVLWAVEKGITAGVSATTFAPKEAVNRAQAVTFLARMAGVDTSAGSTQKFSDVPVGKYYTGAVAWAVDNGITTGAAAAAFAPKADCNRAQVVTFLYRFFIAGEKTAE